MLTRPNFNGPMLWLLWVLGMKQESKPEYPFSSYSKIDGLSLQIQIVESKHRVMERDQFAILQAHWYKPISGPRRPKINCNP